jgi:hypothetical protein
MRGCHSPGTGRHRGGIKLATMDAHRATEAAADIERRFDNGVARETRRHRFEIHDFRGGRRRAIRILLVRSAAVRQVLKFYADKTSVSMWSSRRRQSTPRSSQQRRRLRCSPRGLASRAPAELLAIPPHYRGRRFETDADAATLVDIRALGGNAPDDFLGGQYRCHLPPP